MIEKERKKEKTQIFIYKEITQDFYLHTGTAHNALVIENVGVVGSGEVESVGEVLAVAAVVGTCRRPVVRERRRVLQHAEGPELHRRRLAYSGHGAYKKEKVYGIFQIKIITPCKYKIPRA